MRFVLALALLTGLWASANAATVHRPKSPALRLHSGQRVIVTPGQTVTPGFAVPGWTDEQTRHWLDNTSASWHQA